MTWLFHNCVSSVDQPAVGRGSQGKKTLQRGRWSSFFFGGGSMVAMEEHSKD